MPPTTCIPNKEHFIYFQQSKSYNNGCFTGSGKFYRGTESDDVCVTDCAKAGSDSNCGGIVEESWVRLYDTAEECCSKEYQWIETELCTVRTNLNTTDKYWPDQANGKCWKDSTKPATDLSVALYDTPEDCCKKGNGWQTLAECITEGNAAAAQGTGKYFVDWNKEKCLKDCDTAIGSDCGGRAKAWDALYDSASVCCKQLHWIPREDCL